MKVSILCSDCNHPIQGPLREWGTSRRNAHEIEIAQQSSKLSGGDLLFLISCHEIIKAPTLDRYRKALVIHASDLPHGRGWSPHIWAVLEGRPELTVTLLEVREPVDTGPIWAKRNIALA